VRCELGWVYEEGEDCQGVRSERVPDWTGTIVPSDQLWFLQKGVESERRKGLTEVEVAFVQSSHGGDDADRLVLFERSLTPCSEVGQRRDGRDQGRAGSSRGGHGSCEGACESLC
jgi:hypothetical protein